MLYNNFDRSQVLENLLIVQLDKNKVLVFLLTFHCPLQLSNCLVLAAMEMEMRAFPWEQKMS